MRTLAASAVALSLLVAGATAATAEKPPKVLDGKKVTSIVLQQEAPPGVAGIDPTPEQVAACKPPACARLPFVYKPAKGVTAPLTVSGHYFWAGVSDDDLYLLQGSTVVASCTGHASKHRYLEVPPTALKPGMTYTAVLYYSREIGEATSIEVKLPGEPKPEQARVNQNNPFDFGTTMCGT